MSMVTTVSRSADVSEFHDVGPEDEKAFGPNFQHRCRHLNLKAKTTMCNISRSDNGDS